MQDALAVPFNNSSRLIEYVIAIFTVVNHHSRYLKKQKKILFSGFKRSCLCTLTGEL